MTQSESSAPLRLFNSWSREIEHFVPIDRHVVRLYSCGPTVYDFAHIGNLRAYVFTDTLRRGLNWKGFAVNHVINITDVGHLVSDADEGDDKMEAAAKRQSRDAWEIAAFYTQAFKRDLARLDILPPTLWSTATDHIQDMIEFARVLERHGVTYRLDSGLYFDTAKLPEYGHLARSVTEAQRDQARIGPIEGKRHASDFAIWRSSPPGAQRQMEWMSPWGPGAPGWHLECSVMSIKYLGTQFDIHTGGIDHREIHHCNEIAQNQAYTETNATGATFWMHNNFVVDADGKMSKSHGRFLTLETLVEAGVHPLAYRLLCLSAHYRSELELSPAAIEGAVSRYRRIVQSVQATAARAGDRGWQRAVHETDFSRGASFDYVRGVIEEGLGEAARALVAAIDAAVADDLATPAALAVLEQILAEPGLGDDERLRLIATIDLFLGLRLLTTTRGDTSLRPAKSALSADEVERLVAERYEARAARDFARADALRDTLQAGGVALMDGQEPGWEWLPSL